MDITDEVKLAIVKQQPLPAKRIKLGGDYYFKCYWDECGADVTIYHNYCWHCGQRLSYEQGIC